MYTYINEFVYTCTNTHVQLCRSRQSGVYEGMYGNTPLCMRYKACTRIAGRVHMCVMTQVHEF